MGCRQSSTQKVIEPKIVIRDKLVKHSAVFPSESMVRIYSIMFTITDFLNLRDLAKFSGVSRSFYWITGRK